MSNANVLNFVRIFDVVVAVVFGAYNAKSYRRMDLRVYL